MNEPAPSVPPLDESADLRAAAAGDGDAWRRLLRRHGPAIYALCHRLDPDPDDAYQATWEKISNALHRFDPDGAAAFSTWSRTIARRLLIDRHRRRTSRGEVLATIEPAAVVAAPQAERRLSQRQRAEKLDAALQRLPPSQRRVIVYHHLEGLPLTEIAEIEGAAIGTIKSRLHRARARLARALGGLR